MDGRYRRYRRRERFRLLLERLFPERQLFLRAQGRVGHLRISQRAQMAAVGVLLVIGGWVAFSTTSYLLRGEVLAAKDDQIANVRVAYRSLLGEVAQYQHKFNEMSRDLENYHGMMLGLAEQNTALKQNLNTMEQRLRVTEGERENAADALRSLERELSQVARGVDVDGMAEADTLREGSLGRIQKQLQTALAQRREALETGERMQAQIAELEDRLTSLQSAEQEVVQRLTERTVASVDEFERVVRLAGLDVQGLLESADLGSQQGGPFILPAGDVDDGMPAEELKSSLTTLDSHLQQLEGLQLVLKKLPLATPLDSFRITSSYGKRRDPINGKWAMHYGLDMAAPHKTAIYTTAPGVVTYAGWKGNYGRIVEIDHGAGIKTRFGHLAKILVKKGDTVKFRDKVGLLGNSGRSTGSHLHYEVLFNGRPKDPMKFIKAGRYVFQG